MRFIDLKHGDKFKFKDHSIDGHEIRTKIIHPNLIDLEVLTLQTTKRKRWIARNLRDTNAGQIFRFEPKEQEAIYKRVFNNTDEHAGQIFWINESCTYLYSGKPWTNVWIEEEYETTDWV